jgi:hypothetical protein
LGRPESADTGDPLKASRPARDTSVARRESGMKFS